MQISKTNNIVFLKNVESNIIDEAVVILKKNINKSEVSNIIEKEGLDSINEINILKEAELLINQNIVKNKLEYEKFKIDKLKKNNKFLKRINIILILGYIIFAITKIKFN